MLVEAGEEGQLSKSKESSGRPTWAVIFIYIYVYWNSFLGALIDFLCCASIARTDNRNRDLKRGDSVG